MSDRDVLFSDDLSTGQRYDRSEGQLSKVHECGAYYEQMSAGSGLIEHHVAIARVDISPIVFDLRETASHLILVEQQLAILGHHYYREYHGNDFEPAMHGSLLHDSHVENCRDQFAGKEDVRNEDHRDSLESFRKARLCA